MNKSVSSQIGERYFAVNTLPSREFSVTERLRAQGFCSFLPVIHKSIRHARRFRTARVPLFPSYLFVALDLQRQRWRSINGTIGVSRLVMAGEFPGPVAFGVVESLLSVSDASGLVSFENRLKPGQEVKMLSGPFAGLIGILERTDGCGRVKILLDLMGGKIPVMADASLLAPVA